MTTIAELLPGDIVDNGANYATFIAHTQHPLWASLQLVVWRKDDGTWTHDALDLRQDVGQVRPATDFDRTNSLAYCLIGAGR